MLRIPEETLENTMTALIGLDMGEGVEEVAEAALSLLRCQREKEARGPLRGQATVVEVDAAEAATANAPVGVPHVSLREALATYHRRPTPAGYPRTVKDAAVQTSDSVLPPTPTWEELHAGLERVRALDQTAHPMRAEAF